jgi:hypothetical protein
VFDCSYILRIYAEVVASSLEAVRIARLSPNAFLFK